MHYNILTTKSLDSIYYHVIDPPYHFTLSLPPSLLVTTNLLSVSMGVEGLFVCFFFVLYSTY